MNRRFSVQAEMSAVKKNGDKPIPKNYNIIRRLSDAP